MNGSAGNGGSAEKAFRVDCASPGPSLGNPLCISQKNSLGVDVVIELTYNDLAAIRRQ
jgi:hypothetical protein